MVTKELWAKSGTVTMLAPEGPVQIPFWGFAVNPDGAAELPGPVIEATAGDKVRVILHNSLDEPVCIIFPGQDTVPQPVKDASGRFTSYDLPAEPNGGTVTYSFTAARPGTYLYESGSQPEKQVQMGLYGVVVIRPVDFDPADPSLKTAYGAGSGSEYEVEQVILLSELDSSLHQAIAAGLPCDVSGYSPDYWMVNGRAFPATIAPGNTTSQSRGSKISAKVGQRVLLRCLNAGLQNHSLHLSGGLFRVVAGDARPLRTTDLDATYLRHTLTIGSGQSYDLIFVDDAPGQYYLFDRELHHLVGHDQFPAGMMTRIDVSAATPPTPPEPPAGLTGAAVAPDRVELYWTDPAESADGLTVERKTGFGGNYVEVAVLLAPPVNGYVDGSVSANTTYFYRVQAFNSAGFSGYTGETGVTTPDYPPSAPVGLAATAVSPTRVSLSWLDTSTNETGFRIERSTGIAYTVIGEAGAGATGYDDTGVTGPGTYYYRVQAYNSAGSSPYSNVAGVSIPDSPPAMPTNLAAEGLPGKRIRLTWKDNSFNEQEFVVERKLWSDPGFVPIASVAANTTEYLDSGLSPFTPYRYRVKAVNVQGSSPYSNVATGWSYL